MHSRTPSENAATGTLPATAEGSLPVPQTPEPGDRPDWVGEARAGLTEPGKYLVFEETGSSVVKPVSREWTRIGRSLSADIRFDDATVSRRHALIVSQPDGVRVLDDRSLNGVYVNGRRVEWSPLQDGDEIVVGRHRIYFLDTSPVGAQEATATAVIE
jgi:pSer/pThr/pTyr-binding forkhead associated (FHA) protein